jgi:hypothetical protein
MTRFRGVFLRMGTTADDTCTWRSKLGTVSEVLVVLAQKSRTVLPRSREPEIVPAPVS